MDKRNPTKSRRTNRKSHQCHGHRPRSTSSPWHISPQTSRPTTATTCQLSLEITSDDRLGRGAYQPMLPCHVVRGGEQGAEHHRRACTTTTRNLSREKRTTLQHKITSKWGRRRGGLSGAVEEREAREEAEGICQKRSTNRRRELKHQQLITFCLSTCRRRCTRRRAVGPTRCNHKQSVMQNACLCLPLTGNDRGLVCTEAQ